MKLLRAAAICFLLISPAADADTVLTGWVVGVTDGDTITVRAADNRQLTIRLRGVDAPERLQPSGDRSRTSLSALLFNQDVRVEAMQPDRGQPLLGRVLVRPPDCRTCPLTLDAGLAQIATGMAWRSRDAARELPESERAPYEQAEFNARIRRLGLWNDRKPLPPWEWRSR